jgi:hypothetical protein
VSDSLHDRFREVFPVGEVGFVEVVTFRVGGDSEGDGDVELCSFLSIAFLY